MWKYVKSYIYERHNLAKYLTWEYGCKKILGTDGVNIRSLSAYVFRLIL